MTILYKLASTALLALALQGCSTIENLQNHRPKFFGGSQLDVGYISGFDGGPSPIWNIYGFFDLPFSFVADIVTIPFVGALRQHN